MSADPTCARCAGPVRAPGVWSSAWRCDLDGEVDPLHPAGLATHGRLVAAVSKARVPFWFPWPLPPGWLSTGLTWAGDERGGARASLVACGGPGPMGGYAEVLAIAEEPGVGLGAHWAGLAGTDPGHRLSSDLAPHGRIHAGGHPTALWCLDAAADRAVYVGESLGMWLWLIIWPADAGALVHDSLRLVDLRDAPRDLELPLGTLSARLGGQARRAG